MLSTGDRVEAVVEKPAAGGRMIARHEGQVVFVAGAIPGERVAIAIERVERRLAFGSVAEVLSPSPDRRPVTGDPDCGGCLFAHITPGRQALLKADIITDALARLGKLAVPDPVSVALSPDRAYRLRARLHVRGARFGFYREHTHEICDAADTGQLSDAMLDAGRVIVDAMSSAGCAIDSIELSETVAGDVRAAHVEGPVLPPADALEAILAQGVDAIGAIDHTGRRRRAGLARIADPLETLTAGRSTGTLQRSAEAFFQANRFLLPALVGAVMEAVLPGGPIVDLYAGVGLFGMALAGAGRQGIVCVDGHGVSGDDLIENASATHGAVSAVVAPVESQLARVRDRAATVIVDPPRTGLSPAVVRGLVTGRPARVVYVSCDPATLARDARGLVDGGFRLDGVRGFDLFPNTPHVESLAVFTRPA